MKIVRENAMTGIRQAVFFLIFSAIVLGQELPSGTVLPIMLSSSLNAAKDNPGKRLEGKVMQEVQLSSEWSIKQGSKIIGHVVRVTRQGFSRPASTRRSLDFTIVLKFDNIENDGHTIPLTLALLALASMRSVADAQIPINSTANRDPVSQWVTRQVGGDVVNRGQGKVASSGGVWGTWLEGSSVEVKLTPNAGVGCPGGAGYDREQALWIFSSAACGTYDLNKVNIASSGRAFPLGEIELESSGNVVIRGGSGWLLIAVTSP
jgi:hypothetical protein